MANLRANKIVGIGSTDAGVTFDGPISLNTQGYMYFSTGNTTERGGAKGFFVGGQDTSNANTKIVDFITIETMGNAVKFGDLTTATRMTGATASNTRLLSAGGFASSSTDTIEFFTIATQSNATDFGNLQSARYGVGCLSNNTRGILAAGNPYTNTIDFVTIATTGDASDFGDLLNFNPSFPATCSSSTRGIITGGEGPAPYPYFDNIEFVTIASTGNGTDFGNLLAANFGLGGSSSPTRGVFGGGATPGSTNVIQFITIATTGNATDFGDLTLVRSYVAGCSSHTRGVFGGGNTPSNVNNIDFVTITTTGNASDFGDLIEGRESLRASSNSHGGVE